MLEARPRLDQVRRQPQEVRTPGEPLSDVRRLVVVRADRFGDLVLTLPAVDALRGTYPDARLGLMVAPALAPLAALVDGVDEVLEAARDAAGLRRRFERFGGDLAVCISRGVAPAWAAARAGVPHRVGTDHRLYSRLFSRRVSEHRRRCRRHEVEYALSFAHRAGAPPGPGRFPLRLPESVLTETRGWLERPGVSDHYVVVHPGTGGSCPLWPRAHFIRLISLLVGHGVAVVVSVGPLDGWLHDMLDRAGDDVRDLPRINGGLPLLAGVLRGSALVVGNSTGPIHLAAALGTATLAIHAPWPTCAVGRWGPYSDRGWGLVADHPGAGGWSRRRRRRDGGALMSSVSPETALRCALEMLEGRPPRV